MLTGSAETRLVLIRGNSGSGKTALAAGIRAVRPRGVVLVGQDQLRRQILRVHDRPGNAAIGYIDLTARYALNQGMHVMIEGTLFSEIYGEMLRALVSDHQGPTHCYRYELSFEETLRRHATKPEAGEFGEAEMRQWWREVDRIPGLEEIVIGPEAGLDSTIDRVLADCAWSRRRRPATGV